MECQGKTKAGKVCKMLSYNKYCYIHNQKCSSLPLFTLNDYRKVDKLVLGKLHAFGSIIQPDGTKKFMETDIMKGVKVLSLSGYGRIGFVVTQKGETYFFGIIGNSYTGLGIDKLEQNPTRVFKDLILTFVLCKSDYIIFIKTKDNKLFKAEVERNGNQNILPFEQILTSIHIIKSSLFQPSNYAIRDDSYIIRLALEHPINPYTINFINAKGFIVYSEYVFYITKENKLFVFKGYENNHRQMFTNERIKSIIANGTSNLNINILTIDGKLYRLTHDSTNFYEDYTDESSYHKIFSNVKEMTFEHIITNDGKYYEILLENGEDKFCQRERKFSSFCHPLDPYSSYLLTEDEKQIIPALICNQQYTMKVAEKKLLPLLERFNFYYFVLTK